MVLLVGVNTIAAKGLRPVVIPGLNGAYYTPGLADQFAGYQKAGTACSHWDQLSQEAKRGLVFVDAKVVPKCALRSYLRWAEAEHRDRMPGAKKGDASSYYDLGSQFPTHRYSGVIYTCRWLTQLTTRNLKAPRIPKHQDFTAAATAADRVQWEVVDNWQQNIAKHIMMIYDQGGDFAEDCYLPGAIFGYSRQAGGIVSISFYPHHPVHSLRESAAPVFFSPGGSTVKEQISQLKAIIPTP